jgi:hypothetical protein
MLLLCATSHAAGQTTSVHLVKYAEDGSVLNETTVTYQWMEANLPVHGDGTTHYYHQGPVFEGDKWDMNETTNFKDKGVVKGTNIRDLCDLVGGISPGDEVMIHASDGYHVEFGYTNVYEPPQRQGPIVLCWYEGEASMRSGCTRAATPAMQGVRQSRCQPLRPRPHRNRARCPVSASCLQPPDCY